jgi:type II secretory pathway pseudopilin PulG
MKHRSEAGFSYVDVMIAIVILSVGILALMSGIAGAVIQSKGQETQLLAKQVASSTMESVMSLKETDPNRLGWITVGNVGTNWDPVLGVYRGIFVTGEQNVREDAGPDQVIGTADDTGAVIPGMTRQIVITDECDPDRPSPNCATPGSWPVRIRTVQITVRYSVGAVRRQERLTTVLTDYAVTE